MVSFEAPFEAALRHVAEPVDHVDLTVELGEADELVDVASSPVGSLPDLRCVLSDAVSQWQWATFDIARTDDSGGRAVNPSDENQLTTREILRYAAIAVLVAVLLAFVLDNTHSVRVGFVSSSAVHH